ncbi:MAG: purine-binding chemotaxis protein CheW [Deltaproteobacteria bacterium]|nr:purine-binding chemotaxis protein CheW [Deltaproteobacteria bacterium]
MVRLNEDSIDAPGSDASGFREILRKRAEELAKVREEQGAAEKTISLVAFELGNERYAFEVQYVREVRMLVGITPLPHVPSFVVGITNVRGRVVSVVDIRHLLGLSITPFEKRAQMLILESPEMSFGVLVNRICGVEYVPVSDIQEAPVNTQGPDKKFIKGVTCSGLILLDELAILSDPSIHLE